MKQLVPGDLVRSTRVFKACIWDSYITRTCVDGVVRATMRGGSFRREDKLTDIAVVIAVPLVEVRNNHGTGVIQLFIPKSQRIAYAWDKSLVRV